MAAADLDANVVVQRLLTVPDPTCEQRLINKVTLSNDPSYASPSTRLYLEIGDHPHAPRHLKDTRYLHMPEKYEYTEAPGTRQQNMS